MVRSAPEFTQANLAALLRYRQRGTFATFAKSLDQVCEPPVATERFRYANYLFAFQVAGYCEVSVLSGAIQWWNAHTGAISIFSSTSKQIGATAEWFREFSPELISLVSDSGGNPLVIGRHCRDIERATQSIFARPLSESIPRFKEVESQLCIEASYSSPTDCEVEVYDPHSMAWMPMTLQDKDESNLMRYRSTFAGYIYQIIHPRLNLQCRITQPDWAFIAAFSLLPWKMSTLFTVDNDDVCISRNIRMPTPIYRYLFASAKTVVVGPQIVFRGVGGECIDGLMDYFSDVGDRT
jgi:hypothetical protein